MTQLHIIILCWSQLLG